MVNFGQLLHFVNYPKTSLEHEIETRLAEHTIQLGMAECDLEDVCPFFPGNGHAKEAFIFERYVWVHDSSCIYRRLIPGGFKSFGRRSQRESDGRYDRTVLSLSLSDLFALYQRGLDPVLAVESVEIEVSHGTDRFDRYKIGAGLWPKNGLPFLRNRWTIQSLNWKYGVELTREDFKMLNHHGLMELDQRLKDQTGIEGMVCDPVKVTVAALEYWLGYHEKIAAEEGEPVKWYNTETCYTFTNFQPFHTSES